MTKNKKQVSFAARIAFNCLARIYIDMRSEEWDSMTVPQLEKLRSDLKSNANTHLDCAREDEECGYNSEAQEERDCANSLFKQAKEIKKYIKKYKIKQ